MISSLVTREKAKRGDAAMAVTQKSASANAAAQVAKAGGESRDWSSRAVEQRAAGQECVGEQSRRAVL
ncbi:hypothetical protein HAX54_020990 [Datura stramonium]|uniref:Uncharacterized protein n=1 Tax=Datura stramonium TaxID=4076 RepID=A0ABS8UTX2_DATST|nr:hypothetical protein [Datura stramonium]